MKKLKEITKRIATLGLAAALMVNSFPATAFAAEIGDPDLAVVMEEEQQEGGGEILTDESESDAAVSDEDTGSAAGEGNSDTAGSTAEGSEKSDDAVTPSTAAVSEDSRNEDKKQNSDAQDGETETDKDAAVSDGDTKEEKDAEEKKLPAFKESRTIDGVKITVEAEEGVFPEGAVLSVRKVTISQERKAEEAVEDKRPEEQNVAVSYTYDIKVLDKDGNEIQPADESKVKVSFTLEEVADANLTTNVYHIVEEDSQNGGDSGEAAPKEGDNPENGRNEEADAVNSAELTAEKLEVETDGDTAMVETDGFSLYTVEFTYNSMQYVLPGDSEVELAQILSTVGLSGEASAVEVSKSSLFSAEKNEGGEWIVTAHKAFGTKEWMKVIIDGVEYEITVTDDQETGPWAELQAQFNSASTVSGNPTQITLTDDVTAGDGDSALEIPTDRYVTLDLNGHTIDRGLADEAPAENGSVIRVEGNLTLSDNSTDHTGTITGGNTTEAGGGVYVDNLGEFTMEGGTISGCEATNGGGVYVNSGTFNSGTFIMNGGSITNCSANSEGGGVYVYDGEFTMTDGTISGCSATGGYNSYGGGVCVNGGTFTMENGTIKGCNVNGYGGGVYVNYGTFTMENSTISGCSASFSGGVYVFGGEFTMNDGTISGCSATDENSRGGGVYVDEGGKFTMNGGTISDCSASYGGGVYVEVSTFQVSGSPVIRDNKKDGNANNVVLFGGKTIIVTGALEPGAEIWVNAGKGVAFATNGDSYSITDTDLTKFHSEKDSSLVAAEDSDGSVKFFTQWGALQAKFSNASKVAGSPTRITLTGSVTASGNETALVIPEDRYVTLDLNGHTIDRGLADSTAVENGNAITVSGNLTISDNSAAQTGKITGGNNTDNDGGVSVEGGKFTMNGGTITGCNAVWAGGGVYVDEGSIFTMNGGTISGCNSGSVGGGVYVIGSPNERGMFIMNGGTITGCSASGGGGVYNRGTFTMSGGTITGCSARANGGGVYLENGGTFKVSGTPVISGNKISGTNSPNNVELNGKTISVNGALTSGAEIYVNAGKGVVATGENYTLQASDADAFHSDRDGSLTAALDSDGKVKFFNPWGALQLKFNSANESSQQPTRITLTGDVSADAGDSALLIPAGKYVTLDLNGHTIDRGLAVQPVDNNDNVITVSGKLTLTDSSTDHTGKITGGNNGQDPGGGVSVKGGTFTMDGGTISGCNAALGGGVYVDSGTFTMTGGTITGCNAYNSGGGVCVNGSFTMTGGTITDCNATSRGGGVYVEGGGKFTMEGGTIDRCNTAAAGGGVYNHGTFNMSDGTITNCSVTGDESNGGGVYIEDRGTFKVGGSPVIRGNMKGSTSANNVELGGKTISINGALTSGAEIHVNAGLGVLIAEKGGDRTTALTETEAGYFKSDVSSDLLGGLNDAGQVVLKDHLPALTAPADLTYNGTEQTPALTFESATLEKGTDYTVSYKKVVEGTETSIIGAPKAAGTYKAVAAGTGSYAGTSEAEFTIARKEVTVSSGIAAKDKTYDGTTAATLVTTGAQFDGICTGDSLTVSGTGTFADASAGSDKPVTINKSSLTLGGRSSGNYVLAGSGNQATATANITKATPTITSNPEADAITYGNTLLDSNLTNGTAKLGETDVPGSFAWSNTSTKPAVSDSNKTEYTVTFTPNDTGNLNTTTCQVKLTVNRADIPADAVTAPEAVTDLTYNGSAKELVTKGTASGGEMWYAVTDSTETTAPVFDGDDPSVQNKKWSTSIPTKTGAGTYQVWYRVKGDQNHKDIEASEQNRVEVTIEQADAPTIPDIGQNLYYKTTASIIYSLPAVMPADAGKLAFVEGVRSVVPKETGSETRITAFSVSSEGKVTFSFEKGSVGDKIILPVKIKSVNYEESVVNLVYTLVDKDPAKVSFTGAGISPAGEDDAYTTRYTKTAVYGDPAFMISAAAATPGTGPSSWTWSIVEDNGVVERSGSGSSSSASFKVQKAGKAKLKVHYESDTHMGDAVLELTVNGAPLTIKASDVSLTYGDAKPASFSVSYSGLVNGDTRDTQGLFQGTLTCDCAGYRQYSPAGSYTITPVIQPTPIVSENYEVTLVSGTLSVSPRSAGISWGNTALTYTGSPQTPPYTVTGLVNNDSCSARITGEGTLPGTYRATATALKSGNYRLDSSYSTSFTIAEEKKTFTAPAIAKTYPASVGGTEKLNLASYLPDDAGVVKDWKVSTGGNIEYKTAPAVSAAGVLTYVVKEKNPLTASSTITASASTGNYGSVSFTVSVSLTSAKTAALKKNTQVTLKNSVMTYGSPLSSLQFNNITFVGAETQQTLKGTLAWKTPSAIPAAGTTSAVWVFTPEDKTYAAIEGEAGISVAKADPVITALPTVAARSYDPANALADSDIKGGSVKGANGSTLTGGWHFAKSGLVPKAGAVSYEVYFAPTAADYSNYNAATAQISITVSKAQPMISCGSVSLTYGQSLQQASYTASASLNGTAVAGSFAWEKPEEVPGAGSTSYTLLFTPADTENYNAAKTSVSVSVAKTDAPNRPTFTSLSAGSWVKTLQEVELNAPGWVWDNPTKSLSTGNNSCTARYAGPGAGNYNNETVSITVNKESASAISLYEKVSGKEEARYYRELNVGKTCTLYYQLTGKEKPRIIWRSTAPEVASVSQSGVVKAVSAGTTTIEAVSENDPANKASCEVRVLEPVSSISLDVKSYNLSKNEKLTLTASVLPLTAPQNLEWTSSNEAVAKVVETKLSAGGGNCIAVVEGLSTGNATISAVTTDGTNKKAVCTVKVGAAVPEFSLKHNGKNLTAAALGNAAAGIPYVEAGKTLTFGILWSGETPKNTNVTWSVTDQTGLQTDAAVISEKGVLTGVNEGLVRVKAVSVADSARSAECSVFVYNPLKSAALNTTSGKISKAGGSLQLSVTTAGKLSAISGAAAAGAAASAGMSVDPAYQTATGITPGSAPTVRYSLDPSGALVKNYPTANGNQLTNGVLLESGLLTVDQTTGLVTLKTAELDRLTAAGTKVSGSAKVFADVYTFNGKAEGAVKRLTCSVSITQSNPLKSIRLSKTSVSLDEGHTLTLTAATAPVNPDDGGELVWSIADGDRSYLTISPSDDGASCVLTANKAGVGKSVKLSVVSKAVKKNADGSVKTDSKGNPVPAASGSCIVRICPGVTGIEFRSLDIFETSKTTNGINAKQLACGRNVPLKTNLLLSGKGSAATRTLWWESSNPEIVSVSKDGKVTPLKAGLLNEADRKVKITVYCAEEKISGAVSGGSEETKYCTDSKGTKTAYKAGTTSEGIPYASFEFTVYTPVSTLKLDKTKLTLGTAESTQYGRLAVSVLAPADATEKGMVWTTSNDNIYLAPAENLSDLSGCAYKNCTAVKNVITGSAETGAGQELAIRAMKPGKTVITGRSLDRSGKTVTCEVTIRGNVTALTLKTQGAKTSGADKGYMDITRVSGSTDGTVNGVSVKLASYTSKMKPGTSLSLTPEPELNGIGYPSETKSASGKAQAKTYNDYKKYTDTGVSCRSSDPEIASVNNSGKISVKKTMTDKDGKTVSTSGQSVVIYASDTSGKCVAQLTVSVQ